MVKELLLSEHAEGAGKTEEGNVAATAAYVKEIAHELSGLAKSAECATLSMLLRLAGLEAQLCHATSAWETIEEANFES